MAKGARDFSVRIVGLLVALTLASMASGTSSIAAKAIMAGARSPPVLTAMHAARAARTPRETTDPSCTSLAQRPALVALYNDLNGPSWDPAFQSGWTQNATDPCCYTLVNGACVPWLGLACNSGLYVSTIVLDAPEASGLLSTALCDICQLDFVEIIYSYIEPELPECLANTTISQVYLLLADRGAPWPTVFTRMQSLTILFLFGSSRGPLPSFELTGAAAGGLNLLVLEGALDNTTGPLPDAWASMTNLTVFVCASCMRGPIPSWLGSAWPALVTIVFAENDLNGTLPVELGLMANLETVYVLQSPGLVGSIPCALFTLPNVGTITLSYTSVNGTLDCSMGSPSLGALDLSANTLSGSLPDALGNLTSLVLLDLSDNGFSGSVPAALFALPTLATLDLRNNALEGVAPGPGFSALSSSLVALYLDRLVVRSIPRVFAIDPATNLVSSSLQTLSLQGLALVPSPGAPRASLTVATMVAGLIGVDDAYVGSPPLTSLSLANCSLVGELSSTLFEVFPLLQSLALSNNALSGALPGFSVPGAVTSTGLLSFVDMGHNAFTGALSAQYYGALATTLRIFVAVGNPQLVGLHHPVSDVLVQSDWSSAVLVDAVDGQYGVSCPQFVIGADAQLDVDPAFDNYTTCRCPANYVGVVAAGPSGCRPVSSLCVHGVIGACAVSDGEQIAVKPGFWPGPQPGAASQLVSCADASGLIATGSSSCNPRGQLRCQIGPNALLSCAPQSEICAAGTFGRFCSSCARGYFAGQGGCVECRRFFGDRAKYASVFSSLMFATATLMFVRISRPLSLDEAHSIRLRLRYAPSILAAVHVYISLAWFDLALAIFLAATAALMQAFLIAELKYYWMLIQLVYVLVATLAVRYIHSVTLPSMTTRRRAVARASGAAASVAASIDVGVGAGLGASADTHARAAASASAAAAAGSSFRPEGIAATVASTNDATDHTQSPLLGYDAFASADEHTAAEAAADEPVILRLRPSTIRHVFNAIRSLFQSLSVFLTTAASVISPAIELPDSSPFPAIASPLRSVAFAQCYHQVSPEELPMMLAATLAYLICAPLFAFAVISLIRMYIQRMRFNERVERARGMFDERERIAAARERLAGEYGYAIGVLRDFAIFILYVFQFPLIQLLFSTVSCQKFEFGSFLVVAPAIECRSSYQWKYMAVVVPISVVPLALFAGLFVRLAKHAWRGELDEPAVMQMYGILYLSFKPGVWWYEILLLVKRFVLAAIVTLAGPQTYLSLVGVVSVLSLSFVAQVYFRPYRSALNNIIEDCSGLALLVAFVSVWTPARVSGWAIEGVLLAALFAYEAGGMYFLGYLLVPWSQTVVERVIRRAGLFWLADAISAQLKGAQTTAAATGASGTHVNVSSELVDTLLLNADALTDELEVDIERLERVEAGVRIKHARELAELEQTVVALETERANLRDTRA